MEEGIKHKNCLISNLINKLCTETFVSSRLNKKHDRKHDIVDTKYDELNDKNPQVDTTTAITPKKDLEDKTIINDEVHDSFQDKLAEVREIKHSNYIENKNTK